MQNKKYLPIVLAGAFFLFLVASAIIIYSPHSDVTISGVAESYIPMTEAATSGPAVEPDIAQPAAAKVVKPTLVAVKGKMYPYKLTIPAIKVTAGVLGMGINPDGRMAVPNNYTEVGWYSLGPKPGEMGSVVMGAHVDNGGRINGVFKNLKNLKVGDMLYVTDGAGMQYSYKVTARKIYNYKTPVTNEVFAQNDTERLNVITCYGTWLPKEHTYNQRLVVFTELQNKTILTMQ